LRDLISQDETTPMKNFIWRDGLLALATVALLATITLVADAAELETGIQFQDVAKRPESGLAYRRIASPSLEIWNELRKQKVLPGMTSPELFSMYPPKPYGAPGIAVFDYDNDGDLDILVTNGPGRSNSLFKNMLKETGRLEFKEVAEEAGLAMTAADATGVCVGDIDNDGWTDVYVLVTGGPNRLFRNLGNGQFLDITNLSGTGAGNHRPTSCAFGDVNNDGLVDIVVANSWDNWDHRLSLASFNFLQHNEHNQLFVNQGGLRFEDQSAASGIQNFRGNTWAVAMVDHDRDGNIDIFFADDQAMKRPRRWGGEDHGKLRLYKGDGKGHFRDTTDEMGATAIAGDFMGIVFADFNADGRIDVFTTNMGSYGTRVQSVIPMVRWPDAEHHAELASRWYLQGADGKFNDPGIGKLGTSPFGWGISAFDYDNDGCTDVVFYGGLNLGIYYDASNPGALMHGNCRGEFEWDEKALLKSTNHSRRAVEGLATADLNDDGFPDIVSVSGADWPEPFPLIPYPLGQLGGVFDKRAFIWPTFTLIDQSDRSKGVKYTGMDPVEGSLAVEVSSTNANGWVKVKLTGGKGVIATGRANRGGIGAIVTFTPRGMGPALRAIPGGGGYASNDPLDSIFGMGTADSGTLDILWPGGTHNRLYGVKPKERLNLPELPCDFADRRVATAAHQRCVDEALDAWRKSGLVDAGFASRLRESAVRAHADALKAPAARPATVAQLKPRGALP
jgi:enediyne biosynthesis protein E4